MSANIKSTSSSFSCCNWFGHHQILDPRKKSPQPPSPTELYFLWLWSWSKYHHVHPHHDYPNCQSIFLSCLYLHNCDHQPPSLSIITFFFPSLLHISLPAIFLIPMIIFINNYSTSCTSCSSFLILIVFIMNNFGNLSFLSFFERPRNISSVCIHSVVECELKQYVIMMSLNMLDFLKGQRQWWWQWSGNVRNSDNHGCKWKMPMTMFEAMMCRINPAAN